MLHQAAKKGSLSEAKNLLKTNPDINEKDDFGQTPLHVAAFHNHVDVASLLLSKGARLDIQDINGWLPIHAAASRANYDMCNLLLEASTKLDGNRTETGTDFNQVNMPAFDGNSAFMYVIRRTPPAAKKELYLHTLKLMIGHGADVNHSNSNGETALHLCCLHGNELGVHFLLSNNCNINKTNMRGDSALMYAIRGEKLELSRLLLQRGADPNITSKSGTALEEAFRHDNEELIRLVQQYTKAATAAALNGSGGGTPATDTTPNTPLTSSQLVHYQPQQQQQQQPHSPSHSPSDSPSAPSPIALSGSPSAASFIAPRLAQRPRSVGSAEEIGLEPMPPPPEPTEDTVAANAEPKTSVVQTPPRRGQLYNTISGALSEKRRSLPPGELSRRRRSGGFQPEYLSFGKLAPPAVGLGAAALSETAKRGSQRYTKDVSQLGLKVVCVGDTAASKAHLLTVYLTNKFPTDKPTIYEGMTAVLPHAGNPVTLSLWDTSDRDEKDAEMRSFIYAFTSVFLVMFSVVNPESFEHVKTKWVPEIHYHCPGTPFVLVGTKTDLRTDPAKLEELKSKNLAPVTTQEGIELAKRLKAVKYLECSALKQEGLTEVFDEAVRVVLSPTAKEQKQAKRAKQLQEYISSKVGATLKEGGAMLSLKKKALESRHIPKSLGELRGTLKVLLLSDNKLEYIPVAVFELVLLEVLELRNNNISFLPVQLTNLSRLRKLDLENNCLENLPGELGAMNQLEELKLKGNPLSDIPPEALAGETQGVLAFLRDLLKGAEKCYRMKLMLVGQEGAGKTTLAYYLMHGKKPASPPLSTDGIAISEWPLSVAQARELVSSGSALQNAFVRDNPTHKPIQFSVWDFAGQQVYYATHQFYLSRRSLYLVAFNLLDSNIRSHDFYRVEYWLMSVVAKVKDAPIILVGTHADYCPPNLTEEIFTALRKRVEKFRSIKGIVAVSSSSGMGIRSLQSLIVQVALEQKHMGETIPRTYLALEELVLRTRRERLAARQPPAISIEEFKALAFSRVAMENESELLRATEFLHDLGSLVYFDDRKSGLNQLVILDPQWLQEVMATVVSSKTNFAHDGIILHSFLKTQVWKGDKYPDSLHPVLLSLLEKFEIAFRLSIKRKVLRALTDYDSPNPTQLSYKKDDRVYVLARGPGKWLRGRHASTGAEGYILTAHFAETDEKPLAKAEEMSLVPCLLPETRPTEVLETIWPSDSVEESVRQIGRQWRFEFLPLPFFSQLIVRLLHFSDARLYWRYGILVENETSSALVEVDHTDKCLTVTVRGTRSSELAPLMSLVDEEVDVLKEWYGVRFSSVVVPCCHCFRTRNPTPRYFGLEEVEAAVYKKHSDPVVLCADVAGQPLPVPIIQLAPDLAMANHRRIEYSKLEIKKRVGIGAFAEVYKAVYAGCEVVAVKQLKFKEHFKEFRREVKVMSATVHPNIVVLKGLCIDPPCIVTEFMELGSLQQFLVAKHYHLTWQLCLKIAEDIAKGMNFLHTLTPPKIHRDLKSPNILLSRVLGADGHTVEVVAKVADFGLSRNLAPTIGGREVDNPVWLAPEIMKEEPYTEKADVYSYGIILYELFSREFPFGKKNRFQIEVDVVDGKRPSMPTDCPPFYYQLAHDCWADDPNKRPSFADVLSRLSLSDSFAAYQVVQDTAGAPGKLDLRKDDIVFCQQPAPSSFSAADLVIVMYNGQVVHLPSKTVDAVTSKEGCKLLDYPAYYAAKYGKGQVALDSDWPSSSDLHLDDDESEPQSDPPLLPAENGGSLPPSPMLPHPDPLVPRRHSESVVPHPHSHPILSPQPLHSLSLSDRGAAARRQPESPRSPLQPSFSELEEQEPPRDSPAEKEAPVSADSEPAGYPLSRNTSYYEPKFDSIPDLQSLDISLLRTMLDKGFHRVLPDPQSESGLVVLPAAARRLDSSPRLLCPRELLLEVEYVWLDRANAANIRSKTKKFADIPLHLLAITHERGKLHNPYTGTGGLMVGTVKEIGEGLRDEITLKEGDRIVPLVSLSATPLQLSAVEEMLGDLVKVRGSAVLFGTRTEYVRLPAEHPLDLPLTLFAIECSRCLQPILKAVRILSVLSPSMATSAGPAAAAGSGLTACIVGCGLYGLTALCFVRKMLPMCKILCLDNHETYLRRARAIQLADVVGAVHPCNAQEVLKFVYPHSCNGGADLVLLCIPPPVAPSPVASGLVGGGATMASVLGHYHYQSDSSWQQLEGACHAAARPGGTVLYCVDDKVALGSLFGATEAYALEAVDTMFEMLRQHPELRKAFEDELAKEMPIRFKASSMPIATGRTNAPQ